MLERQQTFSRTAAPAALLAPRGEQRESGESSHSIIPAWRLPETLLVARPSIIDVIGRARASLCNRPCRLAVCLSICLFYPKSDTQSFPILYLVGDVAPDTRNCGGRVWDQNNSKWRPNQKGSVLRVFPTYGDVRSRSWDFKFALAI